MKFKKIALIALFAAAVGQVPTAQAQQINDEATVSKKKKKNKKASKKSAKKLETAVEKVVETAPIEAEVAPTDRFAYSYGVLLGDNLDRLGVELEDIDLEQLVAGIQSILDDEKKNYIDSETAQKEVNEKIQALQLRIAERQLKKNEDFLAENAKKEGMKVTDSGIQYEVITTGTGTVSPTAANKVKTHYHGTLIDGKVFDSSVERGTPIDFPVTGVIKGWQEILKMMKTGDKWRVYIPPHLAYGSRPQGKIPANAVLIFEMELIEIN